MFAAGGHETKSETKRRVAGTTSKHPNMEGSQLELFSNLFSKPAMKTDRLKFGVCNSMILKDWRRGMDSTLLRFGYAR